jgi:stearoyl-CoA desaturase (Delta-9 desaturase)
MSITAVNEDEPVSQRRRAADPARLVLPASRFRRRHRLHFALCQALPIIAAIAMPFALGPGWFSWAGVALLLVMWTLVGGLGVSVGLHRHFAHRAFRATPGVRRMIGIFGSMAAQGPVSYWVALHRRHHAFTDEPGDPHSPKVKASNAKSRLAAFWHSHVGWAMSHDVPMPSRYSPDLVRDEVVTWLERYYWVWVVAGIVLPGLVGMAIWGGATGFALGAYWGGFLRIALGHNIIWSINSVCHCIGRRVYATPDDSRNVGWLSLISFGESWHNNHHQAPSSARFAHRWWEIDIGWMFISLLRVCGGASAVKTHER